MNKRLWLVLSLVIATVVVWMGFWKFLGQDLNLFARQVLPMPIIAVLVVTSISSGLIAGIYRLITGRWITSFPRLAWIIWILANSALMILITTSSS